MKAMKTEQRMEQRSGGAGGVHDNAAREREDAERFIFSFTPAEGGGEHENNDEEEEELLTAGNEQHSWGALRIGEKRANRSSGL